MSIITIITGVTITSQTSFNRTLVLANTAYDVALTLRTVEIYGISSRAVSGASNVGYGLHFDTTSEDSFMAFSDSYPTPSNDNAGCHPWPRGDQNAPDAKGGNCLYDQGSDVSAATYKLGNGIRITDFCAYFTTEGWLCAADVLTSLDIVFARPDPSPLIHVTSSSNPSIGGEDNNGTKACIKVSAATGDSRYISVLGSGVVEVLTSPCP